jgi:hypothetical protein
LQKQILSIKFMITSCQERDAKLLTNILCDFTVFFFKKKWGLKPSLIKSKTDLKKNI